MKETVEVGRLIPQAAKEVVHAPVPQIHEIVGTCDSTRTLVSTDCEQMGGIFVPQIVEEIVEVVQTSPPERIRHCIVERTVPHVVE